MPLNSLVCTYASFGCLFFGGRDLALDQLMRNEVDPSVPISNNSVAYVYDDLYQRNET